jgi:hypothetical protein
MVDLFLEHYLLSYDIDSWQIEKAVGTVQFIAERAWVMRFLKRTEKEVYMDIAKDWIERWKSCQSYRKNGDASKFVHMVAEGDCANKDAFYRKLMSSKSIFCVALDFVPSDPDTPMHIFTNMLNAGIPIIFWRKQKTNATPISFANWFPDWLEELISEKDERTRAENLKNLPVLIPLKATRERDKNIPLRVN